MSRGSVRQDRQRNTWFFVIDVQEPDARRRQIKRRGFRTKRDAEDALQELLLDHNARRQAGSSRVTLQQFLEHDWLPMCTPRLRPATLHGYVKLIDNHINPVLGHIKLKDLTRHQIEKFYADRFERGGPSGKGLSPKTVRNIHGVLSKALNDAVGWDMLASNPAVRAVLPRQQKREMKAWSEEEAASFLRWARKTDRYWMWRLLITTGIRRGELCGLRWSDVNLVKGTISIKATRVVAEGVIEGPPKSDAGQRTINLDTETIAALKEHYEFIAHLAAGLGHAINPDNYLLIGPDLQPINPETVSRWWRNDVRASGCSTIQMHGARHTAATIMLRQKVPLKVASERLGHADVGVTMRVYQHVNESDDRAAANALAQALDGVA